MTSSAAVKSSSTVNRRITPRVARLTNTGVGGHVEITVQSTRVVLIVPTVFLGAIVVRTVAEGEDTGGGAQGEQARDEEETKFGQSFHGSRFLR